MYILYIINTLFFAFLLGIFNTLILQILHKSLLYINIFG
jgi:hypothetical protein